MAEITRKSVLLECLSIMRSEQKICSKNYNCLEPAKGMEEAWEQGRTKIRILEEIIQAMDSEEVAKALANWQQEIMEHGVPEKLEIEGETAARHIKELMEKGDIYAAGYKDGVKAARAIREAAYRQDNGDGKDGTGV